MVKIVFGTWYWDVFGQCSNIPLLHLVLETLQRWASMFRCLCIFKLVLTPESLHQLRHGFKYTALIAYPDGRWPMKKCFCISRWHSSTLLGHVIPVCSLRMSIQLLFYAFVVQHNSICSLQLKFSIFMSNSICSVFTI